MARRLTPAELSAILNNVPERIHEEVLAAMKKAGTLCEAQAKDNCTPGKSPYYRAPHVTGALSRANYHEVEDKGETITGIVGNSQNEYNLHVHEGTSAMQARPFLQDAVRVKQDDVLKIVSAGVKAGLEKGAR